MLDLSLKSTDFSASPYYNKGVGISYALKESNEITFNDSSDSSVTVTKIDEDNVNKISSKVSSSKSPITGDVIYNVHKVDDSLNDEKELSEEDSKIKKSSKEDNLTVDGKVNLKEEKVEGEKSSQDMKNVEVESKNNNESLSKIEEILNMTELTEEDEAKIEELEKTDENVKRHETAHATVGGAYASAPKYNYVEGPDGKKYAISGSVDIDTSEVRGNPKATISKMEIVKKAALAPVDPSAEDYKVANKAIAVQAKALRELKEQDSQKTDIYNEISLFISDEYNKQEIIA